MNAKFGAYVVIPLKYEEEKDYIQPLESGYERFELTTMDISESVKNMFNSYGEQSIGSAYKLPKTALLSRLGDCVRCHVLKGGNAYPFDITDSYLYVFHTKIAFLCLGLSFSKMEALHTICNPGEAENTAKFKWENALGKMHDFSLEELLERTCADLGLCKFYSNSSSMLLEAYTYILALTDTMFSSLEQLRHITFNLHKMQGIEIPVEDDSEADIRYVYAIKHSVLGGYRWGCCVTSQTIAYAVADPSGETELCQEMDTQAADGLPIVLLALYEKYTCLRFTELIAQPRTRKLKPIIKLKKLMLKFQAFGTVTPANLSRWNNVRQIYAYLSEVSEINTAIQDISAKIDILAEEQQEIESQRSSRIINLVTIFGIVGIMSSVQSIVQILSDGSNLMWSVTLLTTAVMALCFGLAMKK